MDQSFQPMPYSSCTSLIIRETNLEESCKSHVATHADHTAAVFAINCNRYMQFDLQPSAGHGVSYLRG